MNGNRPRTPRHPRHHTRRGAGGFTLIEAALVTVIVGGGVLAIVAAQQAYIQKNDWAQRVSTGLLLANELRELTMHMPQHDPITGTAWWGPEPDETSVEHYDDLDDFDGPAGEGITFSTPITALAEQVPDMPGWSQQVWVENVLPNFVSMENPPPDNTTDLLRFTVRVLYQGPGDDQAREITRLTWVNAGGL